ncbi:endonuclease MutS2 [Treponema sp.]|uniref:endonuclease MutS2 n=1 Tax=Treponema sp. TaxID=166 RepID=UPI00298DB900|nr:Smr/MutS family protein [Treponema sp.]MCR5614309.1 Smr/MutS family protein [Treponema sp.]
MNKKTLEELDYYRIKETIAGYCVSQEGKTDILEREPFTDYKSYNELKELSREWSKALGSTRAITISSWPQIKQLFGILKTSGARLDLDELYALGLFCLSWKKITDSIKSNSLDLGLKKLAGVVAQMPDLSDVSKIIFSVINNDGELKDLPQLREIRRNIAAIKAEIDSLIHKYTIDTNLSGALESTVPALRANRQVLAVKSSQRGAIKGIVHEVSQTGRTVYIEPDDVVKRNNDLIQEEFRLQEEIKKVLIETTARLADYREAFEQNLPKMILLDTTCAAAKWGNENHCCYALSCGEEILAKNPQDKSAKEPPLLLGARHPLLKEKAVPIDIRFMTGKNVLIITGPNTGGKTVTLKTFALFSLLNQTGFPVPALEGTRLPMFNDIYCDIGDEQSLDQALSTFSGHMKNVADALEHATEKSLVLLDELGSGTDPLEGSAIAMAALDILIERGSFVLVTTHHGVLKNYGYTNASCVNASVEFNPDTLSPTYRLIMGVPGESHALDIAKRNGLSDEAIQKAKSYIQTEQADISALIKGLNEKHKEADELIQSFKAKEEKIYLKEQKTNSREQNIKRREHDLKIAENKKELSFLKESRKRLENLVRELKEGEITREKTLAVKAFISDLTESIENHSQILEAEERNLDKYDKRAQAKKLASQNGGQSGAPSSDNAVAKSAFDKTQVKFEPGMEVFAGSSRTRGTLIKEERRGMWSVQFGNLKMSVKEKDLTIAPKSDAALKPSVVVDLAEPESVKSKFADFAPSLGGVPTDHPVFELRLLGMRVEEALKLLERQLDLCAMQGFKEFSVIHGKGTGALQQAVQDYLANYPGIADFHFARPEDGGSGKTYVTMES